MTRVLLVDDDPLVCGALATMLGSADDLNVVGSVNDGDQVVEAIHRHRPDIILMDVRMARQDGITTTASLSGLGLETPPKVIMLTTFDHDDVMLRAVHAGAAGFLLKTASPLDIIAAVQSVAAGEGALSARSARQVVEHLQSDPARDLRRAAEALVATLTERERDVVRCVAEEMTTAQIAQELFLGEATVKSHLARAQDKLGAQNRVGVGIIADRAGLT
ncbi:putative two-component system response regulator [Janibacter sp. HTCC2649]|uniref:response regulator n=1 Tax=Janibacter sp. HTCC2649 TaxID=313589 RepID=UPI000066EC43|nr:response regulator transcription factor [Janibacter sp. HTCC2649]EAP98577.1 putative two-component system response regulator [Janibacter sp. HTCC2649]